MNDSLSALNLPPALHAQTLKLLAQIAHARTADDLFRASDRAEGFVLGLETVKALNTATIQGLLPLSSTRPQRAGRSTQHDGQGRL